MVNENADPTKAVAREAIATSTPAVKAAQAASNAAAALQAKYAAAQKTVVSDLNSGNYAGAFSAAEAPGFDTTNKNGGTNQLLTQLDTSQGLQALDPTLKWTPQQMTAYYTAAMAPGNWNANVMGANPDGSTLWGSNAAGKAAADAATNAKTAGDNGTPDLARFAGAQPDPSFLAKWGVPIVAAVAAVVAPEALPAIAGALGGGTAATVAAGALYGAAQGTVGAALSGGDLGKAALLGGVGGGITGGLAASGVTGGAEAGLTDVYGVPQPLANALVQGTEGAGVGAIKGAIGGTGAGRGALVGGLTGAIQGGVSGAISSATDQAPSNPYANVLTGVGSGILASSIAGKPSAPAAPAAPAPPPPVAAPAAAPAKAQTQIVTPPVAAPVAAAPPQAPTPPPLFAGQPTNIGSYAGLGYQPQSQVNANISNYNTYGQGPEAHFFAPTPGT